MSAGSLVANLAVGHSFLVRERACIGIGCSNHGKTLTGVLPRTRRVGVTPSAAAGQDDLGIVSEKVLPDGSKLFEFAPASPASKTSGAKSRGNSAVYTTADSKKKQASTPSSQSKPADSAPAPQRPPSSFAKQSPIPASARKAVRTHPGIQSGESSARPNLSPPDKTSGLRRPASSFTKRSVINKTPSVARPVEQTRPRTAAENGAATRPTSSFIKRSPIPALARRKEVRPVPGLGPRSTPVTEEGPSSPWPLVTPPRLPSAFVKSSPLKQPSMRVTVAAEPRAEVESNDDVESDSDEEYEGSGSDLAGMKVTDLRALAREKGLRGYSKMKKAELIDALASFPL